MSCRCCGKHALLVAAALGLFVLAFSCATPLKAFAVSTSEYAGATMFETAAAEARAAYSQGSSSAIVVGPGDAWIDALSAAGLSASKGPILFTERDSLNASTASALKDLGVKSVVVVGGAAAVSDSVVSQLYAVGIGLEARLGGTDCYDTQMKVYEYGMKRGLWNPAEAIVATGSHFGDALSVSPVAFVKKAPIFLVESGKQLREAQKNALLEGAEQGRFSHVLAVGGTAVVSDVTLGFLDFVAAVASPGGVCERVAGADQYATSAAIANWAVDRGILFWNKAAFATGSSPYDALAGSVLQGRSVSVLLLVGDTSSATIRSVVDHRGSISAIRYFGGAAAVSHGMRSYIERSMELGRVLPMGATRLSDGSYLWCNAGGVDRQDAIDRAMSIARSCLGIPYVWLGKYPENGGMDCASFTWHIYTRKLGMDIGFETYDQMNAGYRVGSVSQAKPGDLILMYYGGWPNYNPLLPEHVVLYAGNGMIYEEPDFGGRCQYVPLSSKGFGRMEVRRIVSD